MADILEKIRKQILIINTKLLGQKQTGKTSIFNRYSQNKLISQIPTINTNDSVQKQLTHKNKRVKFLLYDSIQKQKNHTIIINNIKNKQVLIFIYDITQLSTFKQLITYWIPTCSQNCKKQSLFVIFGNKSDLIQNSNIIKSNIDQQLQKISMTYHRQFFSFIGNCKIIQNKGIQTMIHFIIDHFCQQKIKQNFQQQQDKELILRRKQLPQPGKQLQSAIIDDFIPKQSKVIQEPAKWKSKCFIF